MSRYPAPTRNHHDRFCRVEKWEKVRDATGRPGHHVTYELALPDGQVLRTRVSRPVNSDAYGRSVWAHILRDQLEVTEAAFWACVQHKRPPDRGVPRMGPPADAIPLGLLATFQRALDLTDDQLAEVLDEGLTLQQVQDRLAERWSQPPSG